MKKKIGENVSGTELVDVECCPLCACRERHLYLQGNLPHKRVPSPNSFACTSVNISRFDSLVTCDNCGLVYAEKRWSEAFLLQRYCTVRDEMYLQQVDARRETFQSYMDFVCRFAGAGRLLDIGCYTGHFLEIARERGFEVEGFELSEWATCYAREHFDLTVHMGDFLDKDSSEDKFDIITMWDVIEHVAQPCSLLAEARAKLKPGGLLFLCTYDINDWTCRLLSRHYPFFMEMHVCHFTRKTLRTALAQSGFTWTADRPHFRRLNIGYLTDRLFPKKSRLGRMVSGVIHRSGLGRRRISLGMGLFNVCAAADSK